MKRIVLLVMLSFGAKGFSQIGNLQRKIDSLNQLSWERTRPNLDSLANPKIESVPLKKRDTAVVFNEESLRREAPQDVPITPFNLLKYNQEKRWFFFGQNNLHFNQSTFSNWNAGGNNSIGAIAKLNYNISYKNKKHYWENILQFGYGYVSQQNQSPRKTEDYINIATNYGYELGKHYYLSTGFQFITQFSPGYNYSTTPSPSFSDRSSRFLSPGYLNIGLGISYIPLENLQVIVRPANGKFTFVTDPLLQKKGRYGLERDGQSVRSELGAMLSASYRLKLYQDCTYTSQLTLFSNYLQHAERIDVGYSGKLDLRFNKYISSIVTVDVVYDHDQIQKTQLKQTLGIGFSYNIGNEVKNTNKKNIKAFVLR